MTLPEDTSVAGRGPDATPRVALRFLLVANATDDPTLESWRTILDRAGVPYDVFLAAREPALERAALVQGADGRYQAIVVTTSGFDALRHRDWAALADYERRFRVRQISSYPRGARGAPGALSDFAPLAAERASLTAEGRRVFPYLRGPVPIECRRFLRGRDAVGPRCQPLLQAADAPLLALVRHGDGREELIESVPPDADTLCTQLLAPGLVNWASRGVHLGLWRCYLAVHVDDLLLPNFGWDCTRHDVDRNRWVMMTASDLAYAGDWSRERGFVLDLGINGGATVAHRSESAALIRALIDRRADFRFFNHTYSHLDLDDRPAAVIRAEIARNVEWMRSHDIPLDPAVLVTGGHSGLENPALAPALRATGIRWVAADASRMPSPECRGPATTLPRHPANIYACASTRADLVDAFNHIYANRSPRRPVSRDRQPPRRRHGARQRLSWRELVREEAGWLLRIALTNDPRPLFVHQINLAAERTLYPFLDAALSSYRTYMRPPLLQPALDDAGREVLRRSRWRLALQRGDVAAWRGAGGVDVYATRAVDVPVSGIRTGLAYGGETSRWIPVEPGNSVSLPTVSG